MSYNIRLQSSTIKIDWKKRLSALEAQASIEAAPLRLSVASPSTPDEALHEPRMIHNEVLDKIFAGSVLPRLIALEESVSEKQKQQ